MLKNITFLLKEDSKNRIFFVAKHLPVCTRSTRLGEFSLMGHSCFLWKDLFENYRSGPVFWATFFNGNNYAFTLTKNGLGKISLRFFSQTHLVTLMCTHSSPPYIHTYYEHGCRSHLSPEKIGNCLFCKFESNENKEKFHPILFFRGAQPGLPDFYW
jgi:hypothetical protein